MPKIDIYENHHEVLRSWEKYKGANVITFDYHTDTHSAFLNYSSLKSYRSGIEQSTYANDIISKYSLNNLTIEECIKILKNDEHIDFAVRTNIIKNVFVISSGASGGNAFLNKRIFDGIHQEKFNNHPIIEFSCPNCERKCTEFDFAKRAIADEFIELTRNYLINYIADFFENYILDIDLDYFRTVHAFDRTIKLDVFKNLIKNAKVVTIAKETNYLESCKMENDPINVDFILYELDKIINI